MAVLLSILSTILACGISYLVTVGLVKLICICFGLTFTWLIATGVWLVLLLLREIFGKSKD